MAMTERGVSGDAQAAKVALDRLAPIAQRHQHLHAHAALPGMKPCPPDRDPAEWAYLCGTGPRPPGCILRQPPMPDQIDMGKYIVKLAEVAQEQGLIKGPAGGEVAVVEPGGELPALDK